MSQQEICRNEINAYNLAITRLIKKRASMKPFSKEMEEVNTKLDDLYDKKYLMLVNMVRS